MSAERPAKVTSPLGKDTLLLQRLIASEDLIVVGAEGMYEARCRRCFEPNLAALEIEKKKKAELVAK